MNFILVLLPRQPLLAQAASIPEPSAAPLELSLLQSGRVSNNDAANVASSNSCRQSVVTATTICQSGLTIPSLWWAKEQFGGKLLDNWLAYPPNGTTAGRIDLVVDRQTWLLLDYLERYEFVNRFGALARDYGYNVRVFNFQKELLATYTCDFSTNSKPCKIGNLDNRGRAVFR